MTPAIFVIFVVFRGLRSETLVLNGSECKFFIFAVFASKRPRFGKGTKTRFTRNTACATTPKKTKRHSTGSVFRGEMPWISWTLRCHALGHLWTILWFPRRELCVWGGGSGISMQFNIRERAWRLKQAQEQASARVQKGHLSLQPNLHKMSSFAGTPGAHTRDTSSSWSARMHPCAQCPPKNVS